MSDTIITESTSTAVINAPIEFVDIADWVFTLPDAEYQRCSPATHSINEDSLNPGRIHLDDKQCVRFVDCTAK